MKYHVDAAGFHAIDYLQQMIHTNMLMLQHYWTNHYWNEQMKPGQDKCELSLWT